MCDVSINMVNDKYLSENLSPLLKFFLLTNIYFYVGISPLQYYLLYFKLVLFCQL